MITLLQVAPKNWKKKRGGIPSLQCFSAARSHKAGSSQLKAKEMLSVARRCFFPWSHHKPLGRVGWLQQKGYCSTGTMHGSAQQLGSTCKWQARSDRCVGVRPKLHTKPRKHQYVSVHVRDEVDLNRLASWSAWVQLRASIERSFDRQTWQPGPGPVCHSEMLHDLTQLLPLCYRVIWTAK